MNGIKIQIRKWIESYFYFSRLEKSGILILLFSVVLIQVFRLYLVYFYQPEPIPVYITVVNNPKMLPKQGSNYELADTNFRIKPNKPVRKQFKVLEINSADSADLVALYRIGPSLASKIIKYREQLGGFYSLNQLSEIFGFNEDILFDLEGKIWVDPELIHKIKINTAEFDEIKTHPYFKYTLSRQLIAYRQQHGPFRVKSDLLSLKTMNDSLLKRLEPYLIFNAVP